MSDLFKEIINKIYLFYSIDLIDSTKLKSTLKNWQDIFFNFITELVLLKYNQKKINLDILKILGDEIIYYVKLEDYKDVYKIFKILNSEIIDFQEKYQENKIQLKFKSSSWIMYVKENDDDNLNMPFFIDNNRILDFIGNQMDEGFRIAKSFSRCGQTSVSLELAYIILKEIEALKDENNPIFYLGLEELKGIWNGKKYPILWYSDNPDRNINLMNYEQKDICNLSIKFQDIFKKNKQDLKYVIDVLTSIINENFIFNLSNRIKNIMSIENKR